MSARQPHRSSQLRVASLIALGCGLMSGGLDINGPRPAGAAPPLGCSVGDATNEDLGRQASGARPSGATHLDGAAAGTTASTDDDAADETSTDAAAADEASTDAPPADEASTAATPADEASTAAATSNADDATTSAAPDAAPDADAAPKRAPSRRARMRFGGEVASEYDSNINLRDRNSPVAPVAAPALRAELAGAYGYQRGPHVLQAHAVARLRAVNSTVTDENVAWWQLHARYVRRTNQHQLGLVGQYTDSTGLVAPIGARTFRTLAALAELRTATEADTFSLQAGWRTFTYWPDPALTYQAPSFTATWQRQLSHAGAPRELALQGSLGAEGRTFASHAWVALCAAPTCLVQTSLPRQDLVARAALELAYTQRAIWSVGYRYLGIASNSAGQSVQRHVLVATATRALAPRLVGSAQVTLQLTQGAATAGVATELITPADESRSALLLRVGYQLSATWTLEARTQGWVTFDGAEYQRMAFALAMVRNTPPR